MKKNKYNETFNLDQTNQDQQNCDEEPVIWLSNSIMPRYNFKALENGQCEAPHTMPTG